MRAGWWPWLCLLFLLVAGTAFAEPMPHTNGEPDVPNLPTSTPTPIPGKAKVRTPGPSPGFQFAGEIAVRYERDLDQPVKADRLRYRNRMGFVYTNPDDQWSYILHLRTGNPFFQNSTWTTLDYRQTSGFWADQAYIEYRPKDAPGWVIDAGEFPRPFHNNAVYTGVIWSQVMMAGGANISYTDPDRRWWVSVGPWFTMPQGSGAFGDFQVLGMQAGRGIDEPNGHQRLEFTAALLDFGFDKNGESALLARNQGNAVIKVNGKPVAFASGYEILDPKVDYYFKSGTLPMAASAEYFANVAPSAAGVNVNGKSGFLVGVTGGVATYPGKISMRLQYIDCGQDAVFSPLAQADFVQSTNFSGLYFNTTVPLTPRLNIALVEEHTSVSAADPLQYRTSVDFYYRY